MIWESIVQPALDLIADNVYTGVFLAALLETIIPPVPSELVFPLAGYSLFNADMDQIHILGVGITGGSGVTVGAYIIFVLSRMMGRLGLIRILGRVRVTPQKVERAEKWFAKYGDKSVLMGRCVPMVRELVSIPAGLLNMRTGKFLLYTFVGSCAWSTGLTAIGYYIGTASLSI